MTRRTNVENMTSSSGRSVPNQFVINTSDGMFFQSYKSIICFIDNEGNTYLDKNKWDYSTTTGKYRNIFLNEKKRETEKNIKEGIYRLYDLNSDDALNNAFFNGGK